MRFYGFEAEELADTATPDLDLELDPKCAWALRHPDQFPVDLNRAELERLLRVPGIGPVSARRIVQARKYRAVRFEHLSRMGVVVRRASPFITCPGGLTCARAPAEVELRRLLADQAGRERQFPRQMRIEEAVRVSVV